MADITYCANAQCPFADCERHLSHITGTYRDGQKLVSVAALDGTCRRYIAHLVEDAKDDD